MRSVKTAAVLAATLLLASCGTSSPEPAAAPTSTPKAAADPTPAKPLAVETAAPSECIKYEAPLEPGAEEAQAAVSNAALPPGIVLNPGMQVIASSDDSGMVEAVARICSGGMTRDQLVEAGGAIARSLAASPFGDTLTKLTVSPYTPSGQYLDRDPDTQPITTDFELFIWDAEPSTLARNWR